MARRVVSRVTAAGRFEQHEPTTAAESDRLAEMLRDRAPPQISGTDSLRFGSSVRRNKRFDNHPFRSMPGLARDEYLRQSREMGISVDGKYYNPSLVRPEYQGRFDPEALVGSSHETQAVLARHPEWSAQGLYEQVGREQEVPDDDGVYHVAERIVEEEAINALHAQDVETVSVKDFERLKDTTRRRLEGAMND